MVRALTIVDSVRLGHASWDDDRTARLKSVSTLVILVTMAITVVNMLRADRSQLRQILDLVLLASELTAFGVLHRTKSLDVTFKVFIPFFLVVQAMTILLVGNVEADLLAFVVAPTAAVVLLGHDRSVPWFVVCFVAVLAFGAVEPFLGDAALAINVSSDNPTGSLFDYPSREPVGSAEAMATALSSFFIYFLTRSGYRQLEEAHDVIEQKNTELAAAHERSEGLLGNMLPSSVAERLKAAPSDVVADDFELVTILFADIVQFTPLASALGAQDSVSLLNTLFTRFDGLSALHGVEKIKTIGDAYMAAGGIDNKHSADAEAVALLALDMLTSTAEVSEELSLDIRIRIGIHSGPAVAGVIGTSRFSYDIWGDSVNTASRMESQGTVGRIQISEDTRHLLGAAFQVEDGGVIDVKGKGPSRVFFLAGHVNA